MRNAFDNVLMMVEQYSHSLFLELVTSSCTSSALISIFQQRILGTFGPPSSVVTDRSSLFTSSVELLQVGANQHLATMGHPQSNGVAENIVRMAQEILCCYQDKKKWFEVLPEVALVLNACPSHSSGASPYFILFGQALAQGLMQ